MTNKYTVEKGQRGCWIIRDPNGISVHSVNSKAYAVERAAELTSMMERAHRTATPEGSRYHDSQPDAEGGQS